MNEHNETYLYNGSFLNLLTLIEYLIKNRIKPLNIKDTNYEATLLDEIINLNLADNELVINNIKSEFGKTTLKVMYYVFLSNDTNKELIIYYLFLNSIKYKKDILNMRNLNCVSKSIKTARYVRHESHKMKGFLRFKELHNNVLYAEMEPTNNILELVSLHFKARLKNEYWMICDKKRHLVSIYDKLDFYIINERNILIDKTTIEKEKDYEIMWQEFYKTIGIQERKNDRCRMNFMPKKYWKYMIEMDGEE